MTFTLHKPENIISYLLMLICRSKLLLLTTLYLDGCQLQSVYPCDTLLLWSLLYLSLRIEANNLPRKLLFSFRSLSPLITFVPITVLTCGFRLSVMSEGLTPADIAGAVRFAQTAALSSALKSGHLNQLQITQTHLLDAIHSLKSSGYSSPEVDEKHCAPYRSIYSVTDDRSLFSASVLIETPHPNNLIAPCLKLLLQKTGYYVKVSASNFLSK